MSPTLAKGHVCEASRKYTQKTIEGYLGSVPSLTFNTIKTKLIVPVFQRSRSLQSK